MKTRPEIEHLSALFSHYCSYRSLSRNPSSFSRFLASIIPDMNTPPARLENHSLRTLLYPASS